MGPAGGPWGGQRGARVLCSWGAGDRTQHGSTRAGDSASWPSGSESSTDCPGRRGTQAPRVVWALSQGGWGSGETPGGRGPGAEKHFRNWGGDDGG